MDPSLILNYNKLNNSFKKILVFNIGTEAGFFSEYNNMILAMLYCLKNKIKFTLYSSNANFSKAQGWQDFFIPFCEENKSWVNKKYNLRPYQFNKKMKLFARFFKYTVGVDFFTQDLWDLYRNADFEKEKFNIPELGLINSSLLEASYKLNSFVWSYNMLSCQQINCFKESVKLPNKYISIHIRAGDKINETSVYDLEQYMNLAEKISENKKAFILTDDYTIIETLNKDYRDWEIFTLCKPSERGYFHHDFVKMDNYYKYNQHLKLFASLDLCALSEKFIGTYSSNIGMFMGMRLGESKCFCLDDKTWKIW